MHLIINEPGLLSSKKESEVIDKGKNVMIEDNIKILFKYGLTPVSRGESNSISSPFWVQWLKWLNLLIKNFRYMVSDGAYSNCDVLGGASSNDDHVIGGNMNVKMMKIWAKRLILQRWKIYS